jgi:conjugative transfer signal peptidase TraF
MKRRCWILRVATAAIGLAILIGTGLIGYRLPTALGYCLNLTPSEPVGIYRLVKGGAERGALVLLKQPTGPTALVLHRYAPANIPLIKRVAAVAGDVVQVGAHGVRIDGTLWPDSAPLDRDAEGKSLQPYPFATYRVRTGQIWVMSEHPRGIDSRYFGPVTETSIISRLTPVTLWSSSAVSQALLFVYIVFVAAVAILIAMAIVNSSYARFIAPRELRSE